VVGVLDVGEELSSMSHEMGAASKKIAGGAHF
jgi:hypothetical protein